MIKILLLLLTLSSCQTINSFFDYPTRYQAGDCVMIIDSPNGMTSSKNFVRVEKIKQSEGYYVYRWWLGDDQGWSLFNTIGRGEIKGKQFIFGEFENFERFSKITKCPDLLLNKDLIELGQ